MARLWEVWKEKVRQWRAKAPAGAVTTPTATRRPKSSPIVTYAVTTDTAVHARFLDMLSADLYDLSVKQQQRHGDMWLIRRGELARKQRYLYVQQLSEEGWLFEQNQTGWLITRASFIASNNTFLRARESWDHVTILQAGIDEDLYRLQSHRFGPDHLSFYIYRELMATSLGLHGTVQ